MNSDKNIPGENEQDKILGYLGGNMQDKEQHDFERMAENDPFLADAVEGLSEVKDKNEISGIIAQLNKDLKKQVEKKKKRKEKRKLTDQPFLYITIITLLLLIIVAFLVVKNFN